MIPHITNFDDARREIGRVTNNGLEDVSSLVTWVGGSPAIGNGSLVAYLYRSQQWADLYLRLTAGSTTTFGSGNWTFSIPLLAPFIVPSPHGSGFAFDTSGSATYPVIPDLVAMSSTATSIGIQAGTSRVTSAVPFTWADGDILDFNIRWPLVG